MPTHCLPIDLLRAEWPPALLRYTALSLFISVFAARLAGFGSAIFSNQCDVFARVLCFPGLCTETAKNSGIFTREWTKAKVQMDCNSYTPTITWK